eukprot:jgi/Chrzof1/13061/Cz07g18130.t1
MLQTADVPAPDSCINGKAVGDMFSCRITLPAGLESKQPDEADGCTEQGEALQTAAQLALRCLIDNSKAVSLPAGIIPELNAVSTSSTPTTSGQPPLISDTVQKQQHGLVSNSRSGTAKASQQQQQQQQQLSTLPHTLQQKLPAVMSSGSSNMPTLAVHPPPAPPPSSMWYLWLETVSTGQMPELANYSDVTLDTFVPRDSPTWPWGELLEVACVLLDSKFQVVDGGESPLITLWMHQHSRQQLGDAAHGIQPVHWLLERCSQDTAVAVEDGEAQLVKFVQHVQHTHFGWGSKHDVRFGGSRGGSDVRPALQPIPISSSNSSCALNSMTEDSKGTNTAKPAHQTNCYTSRPTSIKKLTLCSSHLVRSMSLIDMYMPTLAATLRDLQLPKLDLKAVDLVCQQRQPQLYAAAPRTQGTCHGTQQARQGYCRMRHYKDKLASGRL